MTNKLTANFVKNVKTAGKYYDGGGHGLCLRVDKKGYKRWVQRIRVRGRQRDLGLGSPPLVSLADARGKALENKRLVINGGNPSNLKSDKPTQITFSEAIQLRFDKQAAEFGSLKHEKQWLSNLRRYVEPSLGRRYVDEITKHDVIDVLQPIWLTKNATARKIQQQIQSIFSTCKVSGYISGDNPAEWRNNLSELLPNPSKIRTTQNHPALQKKDAARWWAELQTRDGNGALALQFLTLTCVRSGDVRGMKWSEIDFDEKMWVAPRERRKTDQDLRTPISSHMMKILNLLSARSQNEFVFMNSKGTMLSDMTLSALMKRMHLSDLKAGGNGFIDLRSQKPAVPHGLRSTFKGWAAECGYDDIMTEIQLTHQVGSEQYRAYMRSDLMDRRRNMLEDWGEFLLGKTTNTMGFEV